MYVCMYLYVHVCTYVCGRNIARRDHSACSACLCVCVYVHTYIHTQGYVCVPEASGKEMTLSPVAGIISNEVVAPSSPKISGNLPEINARTCVCAFVSSGYVWIHADICINKRANLCM